MGIVVRRLSRLAALAGWLGPANYKAQRPRLLRKTDKFWRIERKRISIFFVLGGLLSGSRNWAVFAWEGEVEVRQGLPALRFDPPRLRLRPTHPVGPPPSLA